MWGAVGLCVGSAQRASGLVSLTVSPYETGEVGGVGLVRVTDVTVDGGQL